MLHFSLFQIFTPEFYSNPNSNARFLFGTIFRRSILIPPTFLTLWTPPRLRISFTIYAGLKFLKNIDLALVKTRVKKKPFYEYTLSFEKLKQQLCCSLLFITYLKQCYFICCNVKVPRFNEITRHDKCLQRLMKKRDLYN